MTCIVGVIDGSSGWMGGDRRAVQDTSILDLARPKIWKDGGALIGSCGSGRASQIVRYGQSLMDGAIPGDDVFGWLVNHVVPRMRSGLKSGGCLKKDDELERTDNEFLIAWNGCLFTIHGNFDVTQHSLLYAAIGSGAGVAQGAIYALNKTRFLDNLSVDQIITIALSAAATFQVGVAGPFDILSSDE